MLWIRFSSNMLNVEKAKTYCIVIFTFICRFTSAQSDGLVVLLFIVSVVELSGDFKHSVQHSCSVLRVPLLLLPLDIQIPQSVRVEVQTCCCNCILKHPED